LSHADRFQTLTLAIPYPHSFAFVAYVIALQIFLLYVRIQAKAANDRTPITLNNPLSSVLQSQLDPKNGGGNGIMKNLASSFLSSQSTFMEYDLKQARSMQSGLVVNMLFMWFLHFKMEQVQPLLIQSVTGIVNMLYSPLFQIYILGRNLERPFKNPATKKQVEGPTNISIDEPETATVSTEPDTKPEAVAEDDEEDDDEADDEVDEEDDDDDDDDADEILEGEPAADEETKEGQALEEEGDAVEEDEEDYSEDEAEAEGNDDDKEGD
jgi:Phosphate transport (Pho88)